MCGCAQGWSGLCIDSSPECFPRDSCMRFSRKAQGRSLLCLQSWSGGHTGQSPSEKDKEEKKESVPPPMSKVPGGQLCHVFIPTFSPLLDQWSLQIHSLHRNRASACSWKNQRHQLSEAFPSSSSLEPKTSAVVLASWQQLSKRQTALFGTPALVSVPASFPSKTARSHLAAESQHPREKLLTFCRVEGHSFIMLAEDWFGNREGRPATLLGASLDMWMARIPQGSHATESQYTPTRSTEMPPPPTTPHAALVPMLLLQGLQESRQGTLLRNTSQYGSLS